MKVMKHGINDMDELEEILRVIFDRSPNFEHRFIARGYEDPEKGWGVWDRKEQRYLNNHEIIDLTEDDLNSKFLN